MMEGVELPTLSTGEPDCVWTTNYRSERWAGLVILGRALWVYLVFAGLRKRKDQGNVVPKLEVRNVFDLKSRRLLFSNSMHLASDAT